MYSNGNSFSATCGDSLGPCAFNGIGSARWPVPTWRFGLRQSDDRGCI